MPSVNSILGGGISIPQHVLDALAQHTANQTKTPPAGSSAGDGTTGPVPGADFGANMKNEAKGKDRRPVSLGPDGDTAIVNIAKSMLSNEGNVFGDGAPVPGKALIEAGKSGDEKQIKHAVEMLVGKTMKQLEEMGAQFKNPGAVRRGLRNLFGQTARSFKRTDDPLVALQMGVKRSGHFGAHQADLTNPAGGYEPSAETKHDFGADNNKQAVSLMMDLLRGKRLEGHHASHVYNNMTGTAHKLVELAKAFKEDASEKNKAALESARNEFASSTSGALKDLGIHEKPRELSAALKDIGAIVVNQLIAGKKPEEALAMALHQTGQFPIPAPTEGEG